MLEVGESWSSFKDLYNDVHDIHEEVAESVNRKFDYEKALELFSTLNLDLNSSKDNLRKCVIFANRILTGYNK